MNILSTYKGLPKEIYIIFVSRVITSIGAFVHPLMALILTEKIGLTSTEAGGFITFLALVQAPSIIIGGKLADKIGRKKSIVLFQSLGIILYMICGFLEPTINLAYTIILASSAFSAAAPAIDALNADLTNSKNRKVAYSLIYMGFNLGFAIGPILGGLLYNKYLNFIFIGDAITTFFALLLIIIYVKEPEKKDDIDIENELERGREGSVFKIIFERPTLLLFALAMLMYQFGYSQWGFMLPLQMNELFLEKGALFYGILGGVNGILVVVLTPIITHLTYKFNNIKTMTAGGILYAITFLCLNKSDIFVLFLGCSIILTIGEILIAINASTFVANMTPSSHRGRVSGVIPLIYGAGYAFGPSIMGRAIESIGIKEAWLIVAAIILFGAGIMYSITKVKVSKV